MSALDYVGKLRPVGMTRSEALIYDAAADRGRAAFMKKNGGPSTALGRFAPAVGDADRAAFCAGVRERSAAWYSTHGDAYEAQAHAYGLRALRKWLTGQDDCERAAVFAAPVKRRKPSVRKPVAAPVVDVVVEEVPVVVDSVTTATVPVTVPAPMPTMTRAARKASNRELAAAMRAAGVAVTRENWDAAKSGQLAGFEVSA